MNFLVKHILLKNASSPSMRKKTYFLQLILGYLLMIILDNKTNTLTDAIAPFNVRKFMLFIESLWLSKRKILYFKQSKPVILAILSNIWAYIVSIFWSNIDKVFYASNGLRGVLLLRNLVPRETLLFLCKSHRYSIVQTKISYLFSESEFILKKKEAQLQTKFINPETLHFSKSWI